MKKVSILIAFAVFLFSVPSYSTPLISAVRELDVVRVKEILTEAQKLDTAKSVVNEVGFNGQTEDLDDEAQCIPNLAVGRHRLVSYTVKTTALREAVYFVGAGIADMRAKGEAILKMLLDNGADPNLVIPDPGCVNYSVLYMALDSGNATAVGMLLDKGMDPNIIIYNKNGHHNKDGLDHILWRYTSNYWSQTDLQANQKLIIGLLLKHGASRAFQLGYYPQIVAEKTYGGGAKSKEQRARDEEIAYLLTHDDTGKKILF